MLYIFATIHPFFKSCTVWGLSFRKARVCEFYLFICNTNLVHLYFWHEEGSQNNFQKYSEYIFLFLFRVLICVTKHISCALYLFRYHGSQAHGHTHNYGPGRHQDSAVEDNAS